MIDRPLPARAMLLGAAIVLLVGIALGFLFGPQSGAAWYNALQKPALTPPAWLFGPVWSALYIMIGAAGGLIWRNSFNRARFWYLLQLVLNFLWTPIFFGMQRPDLALGLILALIIAALVATLRMGAVSRLAGWLMVPYLVWISFAAVLNFRIWQLNG